MANHDAIPSIVGGGFRVLAAAARPTAIQPSCQPSSGPTRRFHYHGQRDIPTEPRGLAQGARPSYRPRLIVRSAPLKHLALFMAEARVGGCALFCDGMLTTIVKPYVPY